MGYRGAQSYLAPGAIVAERYEIQECLGAGAMGVVYACRDQQLGGLRVALKTIPAVFKTDKRMAARFHFELRAAFRVVSPYVARFLDVVDAPGVLGYTMELGDGDSLQCRIDDQEKLDVRLAYSMTLQIAKGLQDIHSFGVVHRDLKPSNIIVDSRGNLKIIDFGLASIVSDQGQEYNSSSGIIDQSCLLKCSCSRGGIIGTPEYVSPELIEFGRYNYQSDLYALGVIAYQLFVGTRPYQTENLMELLRAKVESDPPSPRTGDPSIPNEISDIIMKMLRRNVAHRYKSARQILEDLTSIQSKFAFKQDLRQESAVQELHRQRPFAGNSIVCHGNNLKFKVKNRLQFIHELITGNWSIGGSSGSVLGSQTTNEPFRLSWLLSCWDNLSLSYLWASALALLLIAAAGTVRNFVFLNEDELRKTNNSVEPSAKKADTGARSKFRVFAPRSGSVPAIRSVEEAKKIRNDHEQMTHIRKNPAARSGHR